VETGSNPTASPANQSDAWRLYPLYPQKCPPMAGFCELAIGLRAPKLDAAGAKSPIVSGGYLKYSRFRETATGDRVRPGLRGGRRSPNRSHDRRELGRLAQLPHRLILPFLTLFLEAVAAKWEQLLPPLACEVGSRD
jgi:hypothetical protein